MTTVKELRYITQREKVENREWPWFYRSLQRGPSIYLTILFLKTKISPNQITMLSILAGLAGCVFIYIGGFIHIIIGLALLYLNILFDKADGEVARFRRRFSLRGIYLDEINHLTIPALFFASLTLSLLGQDVVSETILISLGMLAAVSMPIIRIGLRLAPQIYLEKFLKKREMFTPPASGNKTKVDTLKSRLGILSKVLYIIHQFQEFFMILLTFAIAIIIQRYSDYSSLSLVLLLGYGSLLPLIFIADTIKGVLQVEQCISDLDNRFKISE